MLHIEDMHRPVDVGYIVKSPSRIKDGYYGCSFFRTLKAANQYAALWTDSIVEHVTIARDENGRLAGYTPSI